MTDKKKMEKQQRKEKPEHMEETGKKHAGEQEEKKDKKKHVSYKARYEELQEEYKELHDRYLRLSAEFDNFRKRTLKEKADLSKYGGEQVLLSLLPVIDDFDRAMDSMPEHKECESYIEGITLIYNKLKDFLEQNGVTEMEALHQPFDPDLHDALTKIPVEKEDLKGKVVDVLQEGYWLKEKVLRHAKVVVGE